MALGHNIKRLRESRGLTQDQLSALTEGKVSQGVIAALEKRDSSASKFTSELAKALAVPVDTLLEPQETQLMAVCEAATDFADVEFDDRPRVEIPRFAVQGSMGTGIPLPDMETITSSIIVNPEWVRTQLRNITSAGNLAIITGYGDSMEPTFTDGSQLIVDRGVNDVKVDSVYVVQYNHQLFIKRLQRRLDGSILMISDNSKYQPEAIKNDDGCVFVVLGRVVGTWNFTKL